MTAAASSDQWIDQAVAEFTDAGAFGPDSRFVSFELKGRHTIRDQFASDVIYGTVTVCNDGRASCRHGIVIKLKHLNPVLRDMFRTDSQFRNEILFYENISPFLLARVPPGEDRIPPICRYLYGRNVCGDHTAQDMIVLENMILRGYRSPQSDHRLYLDFDHLVVALKTLAKFHALSYRVKYEDREKFSNMITMIEETHWFDDGEWMIRNDGLVELFSVILDRLTERRGGNEEEGVRRFRAELLGDTKQTLRDVMKPVEPLAVLCHGDFNRNNMLFLYDNSGRPTDALAFDMATVRYGSPALDLSFFLYMNTDRRTRDDHWDELLDTYCAALSAAVFDVANVVRVPDRERLNAEMRERAFYGLAHVSFFVRLMTEEHKSVDPTQFVDMTDDDILKLVMTFGGDKATDMIADAVQHFIDVRYTDML